jgi:DNA topoisomerase I
MCYRCSCVCVCVCVCANDAVVQKKIGSIRETYTKELKSNKAEIYQRATAMYVIDTLALRVGNEKGSDEADTVGCCSLRVEVC